MGILNKKKRKKNVRHADRLHTTDTARIKL